jgi:hypothetical protein
MNAITQIRFIRSKMPIGQKIRNGYAHAYQ